MTDVLREQLSEVGVPYVGGLEVLPGVEQAVPDPSWSAHAVQFYEASPFTVNEIPFHGMKSYPYSKPTAYPMNPSALRYRVQWNDRFNSGASSQEYLFRYVPVHSTPIDPDSPAPAPPNNSNIQGSN